MEKKELTAEQSRDMMTATASYADGKAHERRRILAYLEELERNRYTHANVEKMIKFVKGGDE